MKSRALSGLFVATLVSTVPLQADYPIASHRYLADPSVLVHDGRVYFFCSNDDENIGHESYEMQSLVCVSSDDLKNWTDHGIVFQVPRDAAWAGLSWAPAAVARNEQFYLYFGNGASGIGVATADSPIGPYDDPIGGPLVSWSTPGASGENMWLFDPFVFVDDDEQAYLYFGGNGESNGRVIKLDADMISLDGAASPITAPGYFEAAWMHKRNGTYYFSYSTNPSNGLRIDYMTSDNPVSGFEYAGVVAGQPPSNNNNNHAGVFEFEGNWYHVYHNRFVSNESGDPPGYLRNLGLEPLFYDEDGGIQQITYTRDGLDQVRPLDPFKRTEGETFASQSGVETEPCDEGGMNLTAVSNGDWIQVRGVDFGQGSGRFAARVASASEGSIELRLDQVDGPLIGSCQVTNTGGSQSWTDVTVPVDQDLAKGTRDLFLVFVGSGDDLLNLDWWTFLAPPSPPDDFEASAVSTSELRLKWSPSSGATHYTLFRATQSEGPYVSVGEGLTELTFTDSDLTRDEIYFYRIRAEGDAGESDLSQPVSASPKQNYDEWSAEVFNGLPESVKGPQADADEDGNPNLLEYYLATNPLALETAPYRIEWKGDEGLFLAYQESQNLASVEATIEISTDLQEWIETDIQESDRSAFDERDRIRIPIDSSFQYPLFIRLAVRIVP